MSRLPDEITFPLKVVSASRKNTSLHKALFHKNSWNQKLLTTLGVLPGTACPPRWRFLFWSHNLALSLASTAGDEVSNISVVWLVQYWGCNLILIWKWYEKVKVRTLPKPLSSHYDRLDLRIDYEGQKVKVKVRTLPQLLFSHYERLDLRIIRVRERIPSLGNTPFGIDCRWLGIHPPCQGPIEVGGLPTTWVGTQPPLIKRKLWWWSTFSFKKQALF